MKTALRGAIALLSIALVTFTATHASATESKPLRVISDTTATGFQFPESAAYDPKAKVLYVSNFGGTELDPAKKEGQGRISKVSLNGKVLEERFLPAAGETMHKPKGIWVKGNRLWVTDIDALWIFDLKTRKSRRLELTGITFANDVAVMGGSAYVSDNRADRLYRIEPADFLDAKVNPQITIPLAGRAVYPNGLWPGRHGDMLMVGFQSAKDPRGIYSFNKLGGLKELAKDVGRLDGLYEMKDGSILATDWNTSSLFRWTAQGGMEKLATGFKGPADFTVIEERKGLTVVVPDLPASHLRIIRLGH